MRRVKELGRSEGDPAGLRRVNPGCQSGRLLSMVGGDVRDTFHSTEQLITLPKFATRGRDGARGREGRRKG